MQLCRLMFALFVLIFPFANLVAVDQKADDLYKSTCQGCHGPSGRASIVGKKLGAKDFQDPVVGKMSFAHVAKVISDGQGKMPSYKDKLTHDEIKALTKYIKEMK